MKLFVLSSFLAPIGALTTFAPNIAVAFVIITLVTIVAQMWFFSYGVVVSELFPGGAGSVTGIIGACGAAGGLIMNVVSGPIIQNVGYAPVFIVLAFLHPIGALILTRILQAKTQPALPAG
jgi:ACS family hexuronate transporter-like MFS transporter